MTNPILRVESDPQADAVYIHLRDVPVSFTRELDDRCYVDYGADDQPVGIDLLSVSHGVEVSRLPYSSDIARVVECLGLKIW